MEAILFQLKNGAPVRLIGPSGMGYLFTGTGLTRVGNEQDVKAFKKDDRLKIFKKGQKG